MSTRLRPTLLSSPAIPPPSPLQFEYQQAQVEREIENLSWMTERAELDSVHVAELQQQMRLTEVQRQTLLRDFFV